MEKAIFQFFLIEDFFLLAAGHESKFQSLGNDQKAEGRGQAQEP